MTTTTAHDFTQLAKEYKLPNQQKSRWEQFLTGTQQVYQGLAQQAQDVASYDISEAYANYKKQQLQLQTNEQLGAGFQQQVGSQLKTQYSSAYSDIKAKEESALYNIATQQAAALEKGEKEIAARGEFAKKFETAIYDFATAKLGYDFSDLNKIYKSVEEGGLGFYKTTQDAAGNITYELTDYGRDFYDKVLHSPTTSLQFAQYLQEEDLYDEYIANADFYNAIVGGLEYGDRGYSESERLTDLRKQERLTALDAMTTAGGNADVIKSIYGDELAKVSAEQAREIQSNVERNKEYVGTLTNTVGDVDKVVQDKYGNNWTLTSQNYSYKANSLTQSDKEAKKFGQALGIINKKGYVQTSEYQKGDIISHNGRYYVITELNVKKDKFGYRELRTGAFDYAGAVKKVSLFN